MNMKSKLTAATVVLLASTTLSSCHIYKKFSLPDESALAQEYAQAAQAEVDSSALGNLPWQQVFTDPMLQDMIQQALENNVDLANAKLNVDVAHANLLGARLSYLPSVVLSPNGAGSSVAWSSLTWTYQIPLSVSWEIDVFGKILNTKRSAEATLEQTKDYEQAVRSQIIGAVANCYYAISSARAQLYLQRETAEKWEKSVQIMKDMKEAGSTTEAAVVQSEAQYYSILASITDIETSIDQLNSTLSLLLNVMPQNWEIAAGRSLELPCSLQNGVPMSALAQRPDIRAKERAVAVAYYATNSARAAFYPSLTITATGGFTNSFGTIIKNPGDWFANIAGSLTAPLFSRGQNIARLKATKAQQQQAMNSFEYSILSASAEVSDALTAYNNCTAKRSLLDTQVQYMSRAVDVTETLFANSAATYSTTYLEVLTAQQSLLSAQMGYISCGLSRTQAIINLYQSLGGGR
jgi:NodT family efflux transporter outer membrane factor (OMF) lipoprotein